MKGNCPGSARKRGPRSRDPKAPRHHGYDQGTLENPRSESEILADAARMLTEQYKAQMERWSKHE